MADRIVLSEMTWTEVDEALKARPVAIVPVGTTEAHGPHLPLSTECVIATEMAKRGAAKLKEHGVPSLILPAVAYSVADRCADFAGTISITPDALAALIRDVAVSAGKRFRAVAFANLHLEPPHVEAVKKGIAEANAAGVKKGALTSHSWRSRLAGSARLARHAGAAIAAIAMARVTAPTPSQVEASWGSIPKTTVFSNCAAAVAPAKPRTMPVAASPSPLRTTSSQTSTPRAPSARRNAISP
jgi:creatinine amidohydrolase